MMRWRPEIIMKNKNKRRPPAGKAALSQNISKKIIANRLDFQSINRAAVAVLPEILERWLPDGKRVGVEWVARNPTRTDNRIGSFKINLRTGRWADFATGHRGGDVISLGAYLAGIGQADAARRLATMLGIGGDHG
jgi:hypothetical protein